MSIGAPPQKWCEQTQPHGPHVWVEEKGMYGIYMSCAGYLNQPVVTTTIFKENSNEQSPS
jgi:hypothetical protein